MVSDDVYAALQAENAALRQRISELEAKKTPPPASVKANTPPRPAKPRRKRAPQHNQGRLGVGIASLVAHLRTSLRLPQRSIQRYLADLHGLRVSVGELVELLHRVAAHGAPAARAIRDQARRRAVVHADETGWREAGHNGYAWVLAYGGYLRNPHRTECPEHSLLHFLCLQNTL